MKILKLIVAGLLLASNVGAVPYTYTYTGDFFTETTAPEFPGLRLTDRITASLTLDSSFWGKDIGNFDLLDFTVDFGPFQMNLFPPKFVVDSNGVMIIWNIAGSSAGRDFICGGGADGAGQDILFGNTLRDPDVFGPPDFAVVNYPVGSPSRWTSTPVPDAGSTVLLLSLALVPLLFWRRLA